MAGLAQLPPGHIPLSRFCDVQILLVKTSWGRGLRWKCPAGSVKGSVSRDAAMPSNRAETNTPSPGTRQCHLIDPRPMRSPPRHRAPPSPCEPIHRGAVKHPQGAPPRQRVRVCQHELFPGAGFTRARYSALAARIEGGGARDEGRRALRRHPRHRLPTRSEAPARSGRSLAPQCKRGRSLAPAVGRRDSTARSCSSGAIWRSHPRPPPRRTRRARPRPPAKPSTSRDPARGRGRILTARGRASPTAERGGQWGCRGSGTRAAVGPAYRGG